MRTALDAPSDKLDAGERDFVGKVRTHDWACTAVAADEVRPAFSYSTGLWVRFRHPEVIVFGLGSDTARRILRNVHGCLTSGVEIPVLTPNTLLLEGYPTCAVPVGTRNYPAYLGWNRWFYGGDVFPCLQIVWPDRAGLFPWDTGSDADYRRDQPDLSEDGWLAALSN